MHRFQKNALVFALAVLGCYGCDLALAGSGQPAAPQGDLAYDSKAFRALVADSYQLAARADIPPFATWWNARMTELTGADAAGWIQQAEARLLEAGGSAEAEKAIGEEMYRLVKKAIPRFSLDRGFEFSTLPVTGERQCLLQSVLIASMLQAAGLRCGLVMVWSNEKDHTSNLGHVTVFQTLADGKAILLDASEPYPHPVHKGLFLYNLARASYQFVRPDYEENAEIAAFSTTSGEKVALSAYRTLDLPYVRSQFDFYRGERAPGGLLAEPQDSAGLARSEAFFRRSLKECPQNPLSKYCLGKILLREKRSSEAHKIFAQALSLYQKFGWVPPGVQEAAGSKT
jgi:tetratricopeptide (TPR) repeat protein